MSELDKLEQYLKEHKIPYERIDRDTLYDERGHILALDRHQIFFPSQEVAMHNIPGSWDAICHYGSYGYEQGLLEIYGSLVDGRIDGDSVVGWLTAEDVIARIGGRNNG